MDSVESVVLREPWDVDRRLTELQLNRNRLLKVRLQAVSAAADATPFHPANAAGTFSYQYGTWGLRQEFVDDVWQLDRIDGVEAIRNETVKVKVIFANVDIACSDEQPPKPRSPKGAGAERACSGNLFPSLPRFAPRQTDEWATYFLMVDVKGAAELTRPVIRGNTFGAYVERIYLSDGEDLRGTSLSLDDGDVTDNFDPQVARK